MTARPTLSATPSVVWCWTSCTPNAPHQARVALRCALDQLGYDGDVISDAVLAVSEFVANATEHAVGPYELRLRRTATEVICEVEDHDPRIPEVPALPATAPYAPAEEDRGGGLEALCALLTERGRGLHIVHELTRGAWGFRSQKRTKTAWLALPAELPLTQDGADSAPGDEQGVGAQAAGVARRDGRGDVEVRERRDRSYDVRR
ncbi:ATP-binding protein [Streptomyces yerevanensis]|uniref:ATP-binding protein n=1 Tax=Streptomyces yerevanensis TaxID=66378 RepID=UPI0007C5D8B1|nr:ATP-binding protein [Streptomyces yerevanensis]